MMSEREWRPESGEIRGQKLPYPASQADMAQAPDSDLSNYRPADKLLGKVALVTGGDSGIGRAVAVLFAREGADVAIVYLPAEQRDADEAREHIERAGRRALLIPGDVTSAQFCRDAVERVVRDLGRLDVLVNNAAFQKDQQSLAEVSDEQLDRTFKTNIYAYFHFAKAALEHMGEGSAIINTGSITGLEGSKTLLDYSATKGAIHAFTKSLAQSLVERKIRVNCVAPGWVDTELNNSVFGDTTYKQQVTDAVPLRRIATADDVALAIIFLASDWSRHITGEILNVNGGAVLCG